MGRAVGSGKYGAQEALLEATRRCLNRQVEEVGGVAAAGAFA